MTPAQLIELTSEASATAVGWATFTAGANMRVGRWLPWMAFGIINWCPGSDDDRCNSDNDCDQDEGFRCQVLEGSNRGECVKGADPDDMASRS